MSGIERIAKERQRQIEQEGWTPEGDDRYTAGQLALAAASYCHAEEWRKISKTASKAVADRPALNTWPWDWRWWKPSPITVSVSWKKPER